MLMLVVKSQKSRKGTFTVTVLYSFFNSKTSLIHEYLPKCIKTLPCFKLSSTASDYLWLYFCHAGIILVLVPFSSMNRFTKKSFRVSTI